MKKLYDLAVKTGSYQKNGESKNRYQNVGAIMQNDDGSQMIFINRFFNPAGVPFKDGSESILVSMFAPKDNKDNNDNQSEQPVEHSTSSINPENIPF